MRTLFFKEAKAGYVLGREESILGNTVPVLIGNIGGIVNKNPVSPIPDEFILHHQLGDPARIDHPVHFIQREYELPYNSHTA